MKEKYDNDPGNHETRFQYACALSKSGGIHAETDKREAISHFDYLVQNGVFVRDSLFNLVLTEYFLADYEFARVHCEDLYRQDPDNKQVRPLTLRWLTLNLQICTIPVLYVVQECKCYIIRRSKNSTRLLHTFNSRLGEAVVCGDQLQAPANAGPGKERQRHHNWSRRGSWIDHCCSGTRFFIDRWKEEVTK